MGHSLTETGRSFHISLGPCSPTGVGGRSLHRRVAVRFPSEVKSRGLPDVRLLGRQRRVPSEHRLRVVRRPRLSHHRHRIHHRPRRYFCVDGAARLRLARSGLEIESSRNCPIGSGKAKHVWERTGTLRQWLDRTTIDAHAPARISPRAAAHSLWLDGWP